MKIKPMLSASLDGVDLATLRYPLLGSPKLDGIRCIIWEGVAYSRNLKPIRNRWIQQWASNWHNMDGELIVGSPTGTSVLNFTQSGVMSYEGYPNFNFYLFDTLDSDLPFQDRLAHVINETEGERIVPVKHEILRNPHDLVDFEADCLTLGYEGIMLRDPQGPYKQGRSTLREGILMKLKRFTDGEATVVRLEEGKHNANELTRDALGRAKRSHDSGLLIPNGTVGSIIAHSPEWGELRIAPGVMTHAERLFYWEHPTELVGKVIHWRSFGYGVKDKPRFPRFYGVRNDT